MSVQPEYGFLLLRLKTHTQDVLQSNDSDNSMTFDQEMVRHHRTGRLQHVHNHLNKCDRKHKSSILHRSGFRKGAAAETHFKIILFQPTKYHKDISCKDSVCFGGSV